MSPSKAQLNAAARARAGWQRQQQINTHPEIILISSSENENEDYSESSGLTDGTDTIKELAGPELTQSLEREMEREAETVREMTLFDKITRSGDDWKSAESHIRGHYTGNSERTRRREKRRLDAKAEGDSKMRKRHGRIASAAMFRSYFVKEKCTSVRGISTHAPALIPASMPDTTPNIPEHTHGPLQAPNPTRIQSHDPDHTPNPACTPDVVDSIDRVAVHVLGRSPAPAHTHTIDSTTALAPQVIPSPAPSPVPMSSDTSDKIFDGYLSDLEDDAFVLEDNLDDWYDERHAPLAVIQETPAPTSPTHEPPVTEHSALKRRRLDVPFREQRENARRRALEARIVALKDIKRVISSKKHSFEGGENGLQAYCARAIQACLHAMVSQKMGAIEASHAAAVGAMMAKEWGGRQVRRWMDAWVNQRELPHSKRGTHAKTYSLVSDPIIQAELRSYMRSNKWAIDPSKLQMLLRQQLPFAEAETYMQRILGEEIPQGLKDHFESVILPRLHLQSNGISLSTIHRMMIEDGFAFTIHKKAIFYDGHKRPDVLNDRQNRFIPEILALRPRIVCAYEQLHFAE
ncbi:hypothetical protein EDB83DRAFT_2524536 [Lactarius deliciosus]|nr:hypothetical protein EDB83DRAFT_2524536 [Lactarius deliciosus]